MRARLVLLAACLLATPAVQAQTADDYPNRTVKIVVSAPAGGGLDVAARIIAERLRQKWGQPFIVENRPGASGNTGTEVVINAEPDGYTLLAAQPSPAHHQSAALQEADFRSDHAGAGRDDDRRAQFPGRRPNFPAASAQEFIAYAKANPGKINFASQGIGTTPHLTGEMFNRVAGTKLVHVPYRGTSQAVNDVIAGHVDLMFLEMGNAFQLYKGGRAKILAIASAQRAPQMAEIPTLIEAGVTDFSLDTWNAIAAPPRTPRAIIAKLNSAINEVLKMRTCRLTSRR